MESSFFYLHFHNTGCASENFYKQACTFSLGFHYICNKTYKMERILAQTQLFEGIAPARIKELVESVDYELIQYGAEEIVTLKGAPCRALLILTEGHARLETGEPASEAGPLGKLAAPALISPVSLYAPEGKMPVDVVTNVPSSVLSILKDDLTSLLLQERAMLENFLTIVSDTSKPLSDQVLYMNFKTIKGKFAHLVLTQMEQEGQNSFRLEKTQREMAAMFGVTRPALARAIGELADEGSIYVNRKQITVLFPEKLQQYAKEKTF